ncbi:MAG: TetR/AcrR family transcriptional regulator [Deltaproteobacteria bacterium]
MLTSGQTSDRCRYLISSEWDNHQKFKDSDFADFGRINLGLIHNRFQFTAAVMATLIGNDSKKKKARSSGYKTKRGNQRRDALLNATKEMIALEDISEISFVSIAQKAEVPLPSIYHYFKNLESLILIIVEELGQELLDNLKLIKAKEFQSSEERIHFLLDENIKFLNEHPIAQKVFYAPSLPDRAKAIDEKLMLEMSELFFWSVRSELKRGEEEFVERFLVAVQIFDAIAKHEISNKTKISASAATDIRNIVTSYLLS